MVRKILIALAVIVVLFVIVVALQPANFSVTRSATINAPPGIVFDQVNDFHKWAAWSPWEKLDPAMKKTFGGPALGEGATYAWEGNDQVGQGRMTISEAKSPLHVGIKLEFMKPFAATNPTTFDFAAAGATTTVTWTMRGENNFVGKAMCLFVNMDKMVGGDFERGLAAMKSVSETEAARVQAEAQKAAEAKAKADAEAKAKEEADAKAKAEEEAAKAKKGGKKK